MIYLDPTKDYVKTDTMKLVTSVASRLYLNCVPAQNGCIVYTGKLDRHGYGWIRQGGRKANGGRDLPAHRVAYELQFDTTIPADLVARHTCDNPACRNPYHIEPGTKADNIRDMVARGRHVKRGPDTYKRTRRWAKRPEGE